jgi:putative transposase
MPLQGSLSIERMCQLAGVSRAGFYRSLQERAPGEEDMEVRSVIQQIAVEHRRRYGYRRISAELRRRGMLVNHKRVLRIIREDNLLAVQPRAFVVTTDSDHEFEVYLNLAGRMKLTGMNQLWVADITYIRLKKEFVYLAVVLDSFSRKVVGWALDRTLAARLPIAALEQAIAQRQPPPGLVHHSDRGVQYACGDYAQILQQHQMIPSIPMSLQLAIPRRVALQQSSPPLHQPSVILKEKRKFEKEKSLNCMCANSKLSQQRGSPQATVPNFVPTTKPYRLLPSDASR